jgi:hypothetical protein
MTKTHKPGETPTTPGKYIESGPKGGKIPKPVTTTIEKGDKPFPPTREPNRTWVKKKR